MSWGGFTTFARHWSILRESWRKQTEADARKKPLTDHEFLPAALEIMEKPPSPGLRWLLLSVCGLFAIGLAWSFLGKVDVVATASGKVIPTGSVKVIQPIEIGYVRIIHVKNGQHVAAGQLLVELDPTLAGADVSQASQGLANADAVVARNAALLRHAEARRNSSSLPVGTINTKSSIEGSFISTSIAEYEGERGSLIQQRAERLAELAGAEAEISKLRQTLPLVIQQLEARRELTDRGYFSKIRLLEFEQQKVEHIQNITIQQASAAKSRAAVANIEAQLMRLKGSFGKAAVTELVQAQDQAGLAREEVTKSERRKAFQQLRAPVAGTVQQLVIATIGGVVQPAQALMIIVPDDSAVVVEANILNRDIGFIREGQAVRVKLEAYNFTDYGIVPGIVESISRDAIDLNAPGQQRDQPNKPDQQGLVYSARIRLSKNTIRVGNRDQLIGPGLAVQAEIKTGERRIIDFLLSPIAKTMDEAGRER